ncbi:MAG: ribonuclease H-like domain-containing protein, partial [Armatimonadota bacterium]|nr:ribonuclease H-like domain-containing protein [Armatimonadota bacterium]
ERRDASLTLGMAQRAIPAARGTREMAPSGKRHIEDYLDAVFLDIETTGINPAYSELTLIALYQEDAEKKARLYVNNLHGAAETLRYLEAEAQEYGYDTLTVCPLEQFVEHADFLSRVATYNGEQFDLPFIAHHLPQMRRVFRTWQHLDIYIHVAMPLRDLGLLRTPNLKLKTLISYLHVPRHPSVARMRGEDAVRLWNQWKHLYNSEALATLATYALEDVRCTRLLLERLIDLRRGSACDSLL